MSFQTMRTFFALLALAANVAVVGYLAQAIAARRSASAAEARTQLHAMLAGREAPLALLVAATATFGSLYLSEIVHLIPCTLCWYQRIAMYPLAILFAVAWWRDDRSVVRYAAPLAVVGLGIAGYHYLIERLPDLGEGVCSVGVPCNVAYFNVFGFISIAYMAASAFALILVLLVVWNSQSTQNRGTLGAPGSSPFAEERT
jgi:disulfide bond formation protein DsbB